MKFPEISTMFSVVTRHSPLTYQNIFRGDTIPLMRPIYAQYLQTVFRIDCQYCFHIVSKYVLSIHVWPHKTAVHATQYKIFQAVQIIVNNNK